MADGLKLPRARRLPAPLARSRKQESTTAKRTGGQVTTASGRGLEKGDVRLQGFVRIECKSTGKASFSVNLAMLDRLEVAACGAREVPMLVVEMLGGAKKCLVLPDYALDMIVEALVARGKP